MKPLFLTLLFLITNMMIAQVPPKPSVDVSGEGIVNVIPDQVAIDIRVEHTGTNASEVKRKNDQVVSDVLAYVKRSGIEAKYVKTNYIRLSKNYEYNTKTYNYAANQAITIKLVDLAKYENLMDGLLATGINRIDGISFSSSKAVDLEAEARKKAVENALTKAKEYASVLNQQVGKAIHISEFQQSTGPNPLLRNMNFAEASSGQQTIAPGEMQISAKVNISFELN